MNDQIRLPSSSANGLYVAFQPTEKRIAAGCRITTCRRCPSIVGHWPKDSIGHEIICLKCANDIPQIRRHMDELAKARGD